MAGGPFVAVLHTPMLAARGETAARPTVWGGT